MTEVTEVKRVWCSACFSWHKVPEDSPDPQWIYPGTCVLRTPEVENDRLRAWMEAIADLNSHVEPPYRMAQRALAGEPAPTRAGSE